MNTLLTETEIKAFRKQCTKEDMINISKAIVFIEEIDLYSKSWDEDFLTTKDLIFNNPNVHKVFLALETSVYRDIPPHEDITLDFYLTFGPIDLENKMDLFFNEIVAPLFRR